jgi:aryl-alcohol dehydrogenase-like predicted oxidoreductase
MTPIEELMRALDDMVRAGKILYIGISDAPAWIVSHANTLAEMRGWTPFTGLQVEYSLLREPQSVNFCLWLVLWILESQHIRLWVVVY